LNRFEKPSNLACFPLFSQHFQANLQMTSHQIWGRNSRWEPRALEDVSRARRQWLGGFSRQRLGLYMVAWTYKFGLSKNVFLIRKMMIILGNWSAPSAPCSTIIHFNSFPKISMITSLETPRDTSLYWKHKTWLRTITNIISHDETRNLPMVQSAASTWNFQLLQGAIHASSGYLSSLLDQNLVTHGIPWNPMDVGYMWCVFTQCCSVVFWEVFCTGLCWSFLDPPRKHPFVPSSIRPLHVGRPAGLPHGISGRSPKRVAMSLWIFVSFTKAKVRKSNWYNTAPSANLGMMKWDDRTLSTFVDMDTTRNGNNKNHWTIIPSQWI
jgi:hypothetical protein